MDTLLSHGVDPIDLYLLDALAEGRDLTDPAIPEGIEKQFGVWLEQAELEGRVSQLRSREVILKGPTIVVDPAKLYDHVFLILLKLHLPAEVPGMATVTWDEAVDIIWDTSRAHGDPLRVVFTILGWGDYDIAALAYVNDLRRYYEFQKKLAERGIIEKYDTKTLHHFGIPYRFEPVKVPSYTEAGRYVEQLRDALKDLPVPRT